MWCDVCRSGLRTGERSRATGVRKEGRGGGIRECCGSVDLYRMADLETVGIQITNGDNDERTNSARITRLTAG